MLLGVFAWVLFGNADILRGPAVGILMGIASGAAMLPYTVIKETNPPELVGTPDDILRRLEPQLEEVPEHQPRPEVVAAE